MDESIGALIMTTSIDAVDSSAILWYNRSRIRRKEVHMIHSKTKCGRRILWGFITLLVVVVLLCGVCVGFLLDCYKADREAIGAFSAADDIVPQSVGNTVVLAPQDATVGFIFYPGAKVEHEAYLPLMEACAAEGILCVLVEMPMYFPLMNAAAADGIPDMYPQIERWYIGGHSLGGYAASDYVSRHEDDYAGLILLASYSGVDLTGSNLSVLSIYGSEDQIMNRGRYEEGKTNLPAGYTEIIIEDGCHAYFGMYDGQDGSESLSVTNEEQLYITASAIADFVDDK